MKRSLLLCTLELVALVGCGRQGGNVAQLIPSPNGRYQAVVLECRKDTSEGSTLLKVIRTGEPTTCETPSLQEATLSSGAYTRVAWMTDTTLVIDERKESPAPRLGLRGEVSLVFAPWRAEVSSPVSGAQGPASGSRGAAVQRVDRGDALVKSSTQEPEPRQSAEEAAEEAADEAAGEAADKALDEALRKGLLRRANLGDKKQWLAEMARVAPSRGVPPPDEDRMPFLDANSAGTLDGAYVVLRPMEFPDGLYGAHSAVFFVPKGTERPRGEPGHSTVYDFNDMSCTGVCR